MKTVTLNTMLRLLLICRYDDDPTSTEYAYIPSSNGVLYTFQFAMHVASSSLFLSLAVF